jgi:CBS-domain-containing membrane protein
MSINSIIFSPETDIEVVASLMVDKKIHTLPVIDSNGSLVGIVGKEDVLKTLIR